MQMPATIYFCVRDFTGFRRASDNGPNFAGDFVTDLNAAADLWAEATRDGDEALVWRANFYGNMPTGMENVTDAAKWIVSHRIIEAAA